MKTPSSPVSLFTASQHEGADLQFFVHQAKVAPQKLKETHPLLIYQSTDRFITRCSAPEQPTHATFYALTWNKTHPNVMNEQFIALEPSGVSLGPLKYDLSKSIVLYKNTGLHLHLVFSCMEQNHKTRQPPLTPPRVFGRIKLNLKKKKKLKVSKQYIILQTPYLQGQQSEGLNTRKENLMKTVRKCQNHISPPK